MIRVLYIGWQRFKEGATFLSKKLEMSSVGQLPAENDRAIGVVRFVDFQFEVKCRCFRCGDEKIAGCTSVEGSFCSALSLLTPYLTIFD